MKLTSKKNNKQYSKGSKTYQLRKGVSLPSNIKVLDESGLEVSPDENTKILTDSDGNPVNRSWLVANNYYYSPSPDTVYANTPLNEVVVTADKTPAWKKVKDFVNDEILLNKDNIRTNNYQGALQRNPNFSQDWDMATNIYDFANAASVGLINRFSPTQNIGFAIDAAQGDNLWDSWMGNSGIVSNRFIQEHPWWSLAINGVGDYGVHRLGDSSRNVIKAINTGTKEAKPWARAYLNRNKPFKTNEELIDFFENSSSKEDSSVWIGKNVYADKDRPEMPIHVMDKDDAQFVVRNIPEAVGAEIHLGGKVRPSFAGQRFAQKYYDKIPSGTYISSASYQPSLSGLVQKDGFWKTFHNKNYGFGAPVEHGRIPLTENSYELILQTANKHPNKFRLDFANKFRGGLELHPESVDTSKQFYQLYHEALNTKNLTKLNKYLTGMGAPKATFNEAGNIELSLPILYKRRFGGKLI